MYQSTLRPLLLSVVLPVMASVGGCDSSSSGPHVASAYTCTVGGTLTVTDSSGTSPYSVPQSSFVFGSIGTPNAFLDIPTSGSTVMYKLTAPFDDAGSITWTPASTTGDTILSGGTVTLVYGTTTTTTTIRFTEQYADGSKVAYSFDGPCTPAGI